MGGYLAGVRMARTSVSGEWLRPRPTSVRKPPCADGKVAKRRACRTWCIRLAHHLLCNVGVVQIARVAPSSSAAVRRDRADPRKRSGTDGGSEQRIGGRAGRAAVCCSPGSPDITDTSSAAALALWRSWCPQRSASSRAPPAVGQRVEQSMVLADRLRGP